jgi:glutathionylspermidine synthase
MQAWRSVLPETRDPRNAPWRRNEEWLIKPAFGRVGEGVAWRGGVSATAWHRTAWKALLAPRQFVAQRRFASRPLAGSNGDQHLCVGVFTVDGKAAGFYGRASRQAVIGKHAQDIAVLVQQGSGE